MASTGPKGFIGKAVVAVETADHALAQAQDSDPMIEVGDAQLRAEVSEARAALDGFGQRAGAITRRLGR